MTEFDPRTFRPDKAVLLVAHNITTVSRLLDIIPAFDNDLRVELFFTCAPDPFAHGLPAVLEGLGLRIIDWPDACARRFDLAIAASHHGGLAALCSPLVVLSHGIGYTKYSPTADPPPLPREVFGLSEPWVLDEAGEPLADAFMLAHRNDLRRLPTAAAARAVVAGDPCYDRIVTSLDLRARYRHALTVGGRRLVLVSSTWSPHSALGAHPGVLRELLAELPRDEWVVAVAPHPNITHLHGTGQLPRWYADCVRAGLRVLPEIDGWRVGLIAADVVIGDNGSVTGYGAAIGRPVLLAAFPDVPPDNAITELGRVAPRLPAHGPYLPTLEAVLADTSGSAARVAELVTSAPGQSLPLFRELSYRLLGLDEPSCDVPLAPIITPVMTPPPQAFADHVVVVRDADGTRVIRRPAELRPGPLGGGHLSCSVDFPIRSLVYRAEILCDTMLDADGDVTGWLRGILTRHPGCAIAAVLTEDGCVALTRDGVTHHLHATPSLPPDALPSLLYSP